MTRFDNPPTQPPVGGGDWTSYPERPVETDNAWRDELDKPELEFVEALDEVREIWREAGDETDRDFARALSRWPEPDWWHVVAGWVLVATGMAAALAGAAALAWQPDPVAATDDSVGLILFTSLIPLTLGACSLLRPRADGIGHTDMRWRAVQLTTALVLALATNGIRQEDWATPAVWALLPLSAVLAMAGVTGWRFSRGSDR